MSDDSSGAGGGLDENVGDGHQANFFHLFQRPQTAPDGSTRLTHEIGWVELGQAILTAL